MQYTLIGSLRSPFVRVLRIVLAVHAIPFEFKVIDYLENKEDQAYLAQLSPINKVPVFMIGDEKLFDSRVIYNFLAQQHHFTPLSIQQENHVSAIYGLLDVTVNLFLYKRGGLDLHQPNWYVERQKARIDSSLEYIMPWVKRLDASRAEDWNFVTMALYSYLHWAEFRGLLAVNSYPVLQNFLLDFQNAKGLQGTGPS